MIKNENFVNVRRSSQGDQVKIVSLLNSVFHEKRHQNMSYWNWMYGIDQPWPPVVIVAETDSEIVGHLGASIREFNFYGYKIYGALLINIAVATNHQRKGIFDNMMGVMIKELRKNNVSFAYSIPNGKSYPIFANKFRWVDISLEHTLVKPIFSLKKYKQESIDNECEKKPIVQQLRIEEQTHFDSRYDELWDKMPKNEYIMSVRDAKTLNWRYVHSPQTYKIYSAILADDSIVGYIVVRDRSIKFRLKNRVIVDFLVLPGRIDVVNALVKAAVFGMDNPLSFISCNIHCPSYKKYLRNQGFISVPRHSSHAVLKEFNINLMLIQNSEKILFTDGDTDVV